MNGRCCTLTDCSPGKFSFVFPQLEQILSLMVLNVFSLLFGFSTLLAASLTAKQPVLLSTGQQVSLRLLVLLNKLLTNVKGQKSFGSSRSFKSVIISFALPVSVSIISHMCMCVLYITPFYMQGLHRMNPLPLLRLFSSVLVHTSQKEVP